MATKPWLQKSFLGRRKTTGIDYPPKRKKPWLADSFPAAEHFHYFYDDFPWDPPFPPDPPDPPLPPGPGDPPITTGPCAGRVLRMLDPDDIACGDTEIELTVTGAVGPIRLIPSGDIDICSGEDDLELEGSSIIVPGDCCGGGDDISFWYCDDCGCGYTIISMPDGADCDRRDDYFHLADIIGGAGGVCGFG